MREPCTRHGCGGKRLWRVVVLLYPSAQCFQAPFRVETHEFVCEKDRETLKAEDVVTEGLWQAYSRLFIESGRGTPERRFTSLLYERLPREGGPRGRVEPAAGRRLR